MKPRPAPGHLTGVRHLLVASAIVLACTSSTVWAQAPVDIDTLGPQPGTVVPEFTATDQNGQTHTLKSLLGANGAMLVFSRSADW